MINRAAVIFGNTISESDYKKACEAKERFAKKYGDDCDVVYHLEIADLPVIGSRLGVRNLVMPPAKTAKELKAEAKAEAKAAKAEAREAARAAKAKAKAEADITESEIAEPEAAPSIEAAAEPEQAAAPEPQLELEGKPIIIGNIRMGFGHYRIAMAMASAAHALGYTPYWFDLCSFPETTCSKVIGEQNKLYSLGSRLSSKVGAFDKLYWEPLNSEGFRKLSYNASDQKCAELMAPVFHDLPENVPFIGTHAWPSQAALHAGLTHVVNAIPDNWPMALHLAEGGIHTVQTPSAALGYRALRGMDPDRQLNPMPADAIVQTGHYIDHELVENIDADCAARCERLAAGKPVRYLLTVGGAGAQLDLFVAIISHLAPYVNAGQASIVINFGDHAKVMKQLRKQLKHELAGAIVHDDDFDATAAWADEALTGELDGIHLFCHDDIFAAVYSTNLLMRACDVLVTKPSELAYYPVPKLMIHRVGGHEAWGAIRAAELGDGTYELETPEETCAMIDLFQVDPGVIAGMCDHIVANNRIGIYSGAYEVVKLAVEGQAPAAE